MQQGVSSTRISLCKGQIQGVVLTLPDGGKVSLLSSDTACPGYQRQSREQLAVVTFVGISGREEQTTAVENTNHQQAISSASAACLKLSC